MSILDDLRALEAEAPKEVRPDLLTRLGLSNVSVALDPAQQFYEREKRSIFGKAAIAESEDIERVAAIPRRPRPTNLEPYIAAINTRLRKPDGPCRCAELRPGVDDPCIKSVNGTQAWYLFESPIANGAFGPIGVGAGKTGIGILLAMVMRDCKVATILIQPDLEKQFLLDFEVWSQHFHTPNLAGHGGPYDARKPVLHILRYSQLQNEKYTAWLRSVNPDLIIADEGQNLGNRLSVRSDRVIRRFIEEPETRFCVHAGTLSSVGTTDCQHLSALALRENSPYPISVETAKEWGTAIDPLPHEGAMHAPIGALRVFCDTGESARQGFRRRLVETLGVITTEENALTTRLVFRERRAPTIPDELKEHLATARHRKMRPDGEELVTPLDRTKVINELLSGFFYYWRFLRVYSSEGQLLQPGANCPSCSGAELKHGPVCARCMRIDEWRARRKSWFRELRGKMEEDRLEHADSPKLLTKAAIRFHAGYEGPLPVWESVHWPAWQEIKGSIHKEQATKWLSDYLAADAAEWALNTHGIVWYEHVALGNRIAELSGLQQFGMGTDATDADGKKSIICSIDAQGTGKNLQTKFHRNLFTAVMAGGKAWEQTVGRTHRPKQPKDTVEVEVYLHAPEWRAALDKAREKAAYIQGTQGLAQKLLYGEWET